MRMGSIRKQTIGQWRQFWRPSQRRTRNQIPEAYGGDGDEGEVETLNVGPALCRHEHKWGHDQVHQHPPDDKYSCAGELGLPLKREREREEKQSYSEL